jgi:myo-inositol-1(or 4)-monophosphatase
MILEETINRPVDLQSLRMLVCEAARDELLPRFAEVARHIKIDGSVVTEADHAMQDRMQQLLAARYPQYQFIGEEMARHEHAALTRTTEGGLWCLDPLDGTSNFSTGIPFFAVSLALLIDERVELGVVYDPVRDECFMAGRGKGAWLNEQPLSVTQALHPRELRRCVAGVDFKRLPSGLATRLAGTPPYGSQRNFGACSLEWCWLADGRFHIYLHGGQKLWDHAAGSLILEEAGGIATTLTGEPVFQRGLEPRSVIAAVDEGLFGQWREWLAAQHATD